MVKYFLNISKVLTKVLGLAICLLVWCCALGHDSAKQIILIVLEKVLFISALFWDTFMTGVKIASMTLQTCVYILS